MPRDKNSKPSLGNLQTSNRPEESCQSATNGKQGKPGLQDSSRENIYQVAKDIRVT